MPLSHTNRIQQLVMAILMTALTICGNINLAYAQQPWREAIRGDWRESASAKALPPFCGTNPRYKNKQLFTGPSYKREDMTWGNHLCSGLTKMPICRTYPRKDRIECLNYYTEGYTYWISNAKNPDFGLLPYLHTGLGDLYFEIGKKAEAVTQFKLALRKNPKYLKAYKSIIDAFIDLKQYDNAQYYLDKAIAIKPHKAFKRRQQKLNNLKN